MKKIMIIPGIAAVIPAIKAAKEIGLYVITADNRPENIGHKYADEFVNVSILDNEALLAEAKRLKIDGIMTFNCDLAAVPVSYVAEKMGLPTVGPFESVCILQNKGRFRAYLKEHGFNVPWAKAYSDVDAALAEADTFPYPVMIKPTDSCGSQGVTSVNNKTELRTAMESALKKSHSKQFIVEEFLETLGFCSDSDYFVENGVFRNFGFSAEGFDKRCVSPFTISWISWPDVLEEKYKTELKSELQRLISLLNMKTAIFNIAVMVSTNGKAYIMECSPRSGGPWISEGVEYATGSDLIHNYVRSVVGMPVIDDFYDEIKKYCLNLNLHTAKTGYFSELWIDDSVKKNIVEMELHVAPGDMIHSMTSARDVIGKMQLLFDTEDRMRAVIANLESYVKVIVDEV